MLFDLRGRGRRRAVQVIYLGLAVLMGGGLVFFGIGSATSGGLFDAFSQNSGGTDATKAIERQIDRAAKAAQANPRQPERWAQLARLRFQNANIGSGFDQNAGGFTKDGKVKLRRAAQAWDRYLALNPKTPDDRLASLMAQAFGQGGLNQPDQAVRAQEIVTEQRKPSSNLYAQLAVLAYTADQKRKGDLAANRAVELADKGEKTLLRQQLEQAKRQAGAPAGQGAAPTAPPAPPATTPSG